MNARREESESDLSYYHRLRKLADMAVVREITDKQLVMHMLIQLLPTNVLKTVMQKNINPDLDDVVAMLELREQQMRQLGQSNFPLPQERNVKKKKELQANLTDTERGCDRGGGQEGWGGPGG